MMIDRVASTATSPSTDGDRRHPAEHAAQLLDGHLEAQRVAGQDRALEAAVVDAGEEAELAAVLVGSDRTATARGLGQRLDHEHTGHDRATGEVTGELRLVGGDLLDRHRALAGLELDHAVDEQERIPMRNDPHDVGRLERQLLGRHRSRKAPHRVTIIPRRRRRPPARPDRAGWC